LGLALNPAPRSRLVFSRRPLEKPSEWHVLDFGIMAASNHTRSQHIPIGVPVIVCGTGSIGLRHLRVLRDRLHLDPIALPTRHGRIAELQAEGIRGVESWQKSAAGAPQFAIIATDTSRHLADASEALKLGANVLVEKPLAPTVKGLRDFAELAARCDRRVFVACNLRFEAGLTMFRRYLAAIGCVHSVRIECQSYLPEWRPGTDYRRAYSARSNEGGVLRDLIHEIDYAIWLFGQPVELFARLRNSGALGIESDESADIFWETPTGASVSIRLDYLSRTTRRKMRAFGELGDLQWDYIGKSVTLALAGQPSQSWKIEQERDEMMLHQAAAFLGAAGTDDTSSLATLEEGAFAVAVCDTVRKSSQSGRTESVLDWRKP
jgi:predicted dehydrogenase